MYTEKKLPILEPQIKLHPQNQLQIQKINIRNNTNIKNDPQLNYEKVDEIHFQINKIQQSLKRFKNGPEKTFHLYNPLNSSKKQTTTRSKKNFFLF